MKYQLQHYELDVTKHRDFQNMGIISELCRGLEISGKSKFYHLIDRLIRLVVTLPVSTATTERAFSTMKLLKTRLCNRMEDELLADNMIVYIKKEIDGNFTMEIIWMNSIPWKIIVRHDFKWNVFFCVDIFVHVYSELENFCMFINV